jgi:hypothetical protein
MRVLVACESSGTVREAFRKLGHDAWSCDLLPADDGSRNHLQEDVVNVIELEGPWDLMIAHPPCTYLTCSAEWAYKDPSEINKKLSPDKLYGDARKAAREDAAAFFMALARAPIEKIAIENPVGVMSSRWRKADQYIQPYEFGDDASKKTGLWLKGLPPLVADPADYVEPRWVNGRPRWSNQTDSGQNRLGPSADRWKVRSKTYDGIAQAMARTWGRDS